MSANIFNELISQIDVQRQRYEETGECDSDLIASARTILPQIMRKMEGLPGSETTKSDFVDMKASDMAKSAQNGLWSSPKVWEDDENFVILEIVRYAKANQIHLPRKRHLAVIKEYCPQAKTDSIPPKLGDWRVGELVDWTNRKPVTIQLGIKGLKKMRDYYPAAREKKDEITRALKTLDSEYVFPDLNELMG